MKAANGTEGLFIQGLSQHVGINIGRSEFFNTMQGAPFLLANNPFVFALRNDCFQYEVMGFSSDAPIYGCANRNPVFTFDYSNDPMYQFALGLVDARGAARGVGRGARDLAVGTFELAENVVGAAAYDQLSLIAPDTAQTLFGPQKDALSQTVKGLGQLGWDAANGVAYNLIAPFDAEYAQEAYGANLDRLQQVGLNATGGANIGGAERVTYTLTQILLPVGIAKTAELGRVGQAADAAEAARLDATVVTEANAERAALTAGEAAQTRAAVTEAQAAENATVSTTLKSGEPCLKAAKKKKQLLF